MIDKIIICTPEYNIIESCFAAFVCANGAVFAPVSTAWKRNAGKTSAPAEI
jgi:hypothetical protein